MMTEEIWRVIEEARSYQVSNLGRVKNIHTGRILKPNLSTGTASVLLRHNGQSLRRGVPKLVAMAFDATEAGETWETCKDAVRYSVSTLGRVRNNSTGRILKPVTRGKHTYVSLWDAGWHITMRVSALVKQAYGS